MTERIFNSQLWQLILSNIRELIREPGVLFWGIIFPILMSLGLGIAFTQKKDVISRIAVVRGQSFETPAQASGKDSASALLLKNLIVALKAEPALAGSGHRDWTLVHNDPELGNTKYVFAAMSRDEAMVQLKRGRLSLIMDQSGDTVQFHFDPMNPDAQLTYLKLSNLIRARGGAVGAEGTAAATADFALAVKPLSLTGTRYIDFLIPGLIAMGVMMSSMWGVSYAIIERRSKKLLRRMVATPMRRSNFLMALISVRVAMNFVEAALLFLFAWIAFGVTIQGSLPALIVLFIAGNFAFAGISILLSCHTSKTEIGNGLINAVSMPMMVLSGIFFSYHNFPDWTIPVIRALPLTMMTDAMRSIMTEGAGFAETMIPCAILSVIGLLFFFAGMKLFKWH